MLVALISAMLSSHTHTQASVRDSPSIHAEAHALENEVNNSAEQLSDNRVIPFQRKHVIFTFYERLNLEVETGEQ